jgi:hypothetical protein
MFVRRRARVFDSHMHRGLFAVLALVLVPRPIVGQGPAAPYRVTWGDAVSVETAGVLYVLPGALGLPHGAPSCAPCDPGTLPGVDRWALRQVSTTGDVASDVVLAGVAGFTAFAGLHGLPAQQWRGNFVVFASAASWTAASTEWLKVLMRRKLRQTKRDDATGRLLVVRSWIAHEFERADAEAVGGFKRRLVEQHARVAGVLVVGRTWAAGAWRHRYLAHPVVASERPGADLCVAVRDREAKLFVPAFREA